MPRIPVFVLLLTLSLTSALRAQEGTQERLPIPPTEEREAAFKLMREAFAGEMKAASSDPAKMASLIDQMYAMARMDSAKPVEQIVMFQQAIRNATALGDARRTLLGVREVGRRFQIDTLAFAHQQLDNARRNTRTDEQNRELAVAYIHLTGMALEEEKFNIADEAIRKARAVTPRHDQALLDFINLIQTDIREIQRMAAEAERAFAILQRTPNDPIASATYGRFRCFYLSDWENGLQYLQKSNHETLRALAQTELAKPTQPESMISLADAWWGYAEGQGGIERRQARVRAAYWYQQAHPNTVGLERRKIESRLQEHAVERRKLQMP